jgi:hypothetical protein
MKAQRIGVGIAQIPIMPSKPARPVPWAQTGPICTRLSSFAQWLGPEEGRKGGLQLPEMPKRGTSQEGLWGQNDTELAAGGLPHGPGRHLGQQHVAPLSGSVPGDSVSAFECRRVANAAVLFANPIDAFMAFCVNSLSSNAVALAELFLLLLIRASKPGHVALFASCSECIAVNEKCSFQVFGLSFCRTSSRRRSKLTAHCFSPPLFLSSGGAGGSVAQGVVEFARAPEQLTGTQFVHLCVVAVGWLTGAPRGPVGVASSPRQQRFD